MTRDEALFALNGHVGERVEVVLTYRRAAVMSAEGVLSHWTQEPDGPLPVGVSEDALQGVYRVGNASIYLAESVTDAREIERDDRSAIGFEVADHLVMTVLWGEPL